MNKKIENITIIFLIIINIYMLVKTVHMEYVLSVVEKTSNSKQIIDFLLKENRTKIINEESVIKIYPSAPLSEYLYSPYKINLNSHTGIYKNKL